MNYEARVGADGCIFDNSVGSMQRDKGMVSELRLSCLGENCGALGRSYVVDSLLSTSYEDLFFAPSGIKRKWGGCNAYS